jgi:beta-glucosidase
MRATTGLIKAVVAAQLACIAAFGQSGDFTTSGKVVDKNKKPVVGATISYVSMDKRLSWDFSNTQGDFGPPVPISARPVPQESRFTLPESGPVSLDVYDLNGHTVGRLSTEQMRKSADNLASLAATLPQAVYIVRIKSASAVRYTRILNAGTNGQSNFVSSSSMTSTQAGTAKKLAIIDSIRVGKTGYAPVYLPITEYAANVGTVTIDSIDVEAKLDSIMKLMDNNEKAGQCAMPFSGNAGAGANDRIGSVYQGNGGFSSFNPGSLSDLVDSYNKAMMGTPRKIPIFLGYDGVHGMCVMPGGTILPHNISMGSIQDSTVFEKAYRVASLEMRGSGATWTFAPCIAVFRDDRWGRAYEGYSETPELTVKMARWAVLGMQTSDLSHPGSIVATIKHFAGDGGTSNGRDQGNTEGDDATLRAIHLPGYTAGVDAGAACVMPSFSSWNGTKMHSNTELLRNWLKNGEKGGPKFDGFVVSDWDCANGSGNVNAGVDVPMSTQGVGALKGFVSGSNYLNDACRRVLRIKVRMNLLNNWLTDRKLTAAVGSQMHRDAVRAAVRHSLVLLKNSDNVLPIPAAAKIAVWGNGGNSVGLQCGGWSVVGGGTSIFKGFEKLRPGTVFSGDGGNSNADYIVAVLSENGYSETTFGGIGLTGELANEGNGNIIQKLGGAKAAGKKVIVILMAGRPLDITPVIDNCDAFVWAGWPGTEGDGIPEVLVREKPEYNFYGRLSFTYPMNLTQEPINKGDGKTGRYPVGAGLSYQ